MVLQGVCRAVKEYFSSPVKVARLWMHECERVFQDRMINPADATRLSEMLEHARKKNFEDLDSDALAVRPLIFTAFTSQTPDGQPVYTNVDDYHKLKVGTRRESLLEALRGIEQANSERQATSVSNWDSKRGSISNSDTLTHLNISPQRL